MGGGEPFICGMSGCRTQAAPTVITGGGVFLPLQPKGECKWQNLQPSEQLKWRQGGGISSYL